MTAHIDNINISIFAVEEENLQNAQMANKMLIVRPDCGDTQRIFFSLIRDGWDGGMDSKCAQC